MADLIIGGNTYQGIDFIKVTRTDGTTAIFYDSAKKERWQPSASFSAVSGKPGVKMSAVARAAISTASLTEVI